MKFNRPYNQRVSKRVIDEAVAHAGMVVAFLPDDTVLLFAPQSRGKC